MRRSLFTRTAVAISMALILAAVAYAHGNEKHVIGTVTAVSATEISVATQATANQPSQNQVVKIAPDTSFVKSGAASSLKELKVGDRVVIHAKPIGNDLIAHEVRFGKMTAATSGSGTH